MGVGVRGGEDVPGGDGHPGLVRTGVKLQRVDARRKLVRKQPPRGRDTRVPDGKLPAAAAATRATFPSRRDLSVRRCRSSPPPARS